MLGDIGNGAAWEISLKFFVRVLCILSGYIIVHEGFLLYTVVVGAYMKSRKVMLGSKACQPDSVLLDRSNSSSNAIVEGLIIDQS